MTNFLTITHRFKRGFTLIEVMIAVAIVAILTAVALPSYNEYILRSHRANARTALTAVAQWMERGATVNGQFPFPAAVPAGLLVVEGGRYTLAVAAATPGTTFTATATPMAGTPQVSDKCGSLSIDQTGLKSVAGATLSAADCWAR